MTWETQVYVQIFFEHFFWMESGTVLNKRFDPHVKAGTARQGLVLKERLAPLIIVICAVHKLVCRYLT